MRWGTWNLALHLFVLVVGYLWLSQVTGPALARDFGEEVPLLMFIGFVVYAGLTTLLAVLARTLRFSFALVHAPFLAWLIWSAAQPTVHRAQSWYAEATKAPPLEIPGMLTLLEWRVYRTQGSTGYVALTHHQQFEGSLVIESIEALRGDTVVGRVQVQRPARLFRDAQLTSIPFVFDSSDTPRRFRVSLLVYPSKRERPCRTPETGGPVGETPIQRLVLDTDASGTVEKLGPQPHECGPLDTVRYHLMAPIAYPG